MQYIPWSGTMQFALSMINEAISNASIYQSNYPWIWIEGEEKSTKQKMIIYLHTQRKNQANSHQSVHFGSAVQLNWAARTHARHGWSNFNILCYQFYKSTKSPWKNSKIVPADFTRSSHRLGFIASVHTRTQTNEFNTLTNIRSIDNREKQRIGEGKGKR